VRIELEVEEQGGKPYILSVSFLLSWRPSLVGTLGRLEGLKLRLRLIL
jgi:hypothetical protein